jgi:hypothetical protein
MDIQQWPLVDTGGSLWIGARLHSCGLYHVRQRMRCTPARRPNCPPLARPATHQQIVAHYKRCAQPDLDAQLQWFASLPSFTAALRRAAIARSSRGTRFAHQWRLPRSMYPRALALLRAAAPSLRSSRSFAVLHSRVSAAVAHLPGVGPLYLYDTSLRLGAFLGLSPTSVYLHAGAAQGARRLLPAGSGATVSPTQFPSAFRALLAYQLENLLCCYRTYL